MEFVAKLDNQISPAAKEATTDLLALKGALGDVNKALGSLGGQTPKNAVPDAAKADRATGRDDATKKAKEQGKALQTLRANAGKASGAIEVPIKWVAAAVGVAGLAGLAKLAMGYAGMAKLQGLIYQTQLGFRALFKGVDPSPVLRAFQQFSKNLSAQTVTGKALGDLLTRGFNSVFRLVEKLEPVASAAFQGMVLGALYAENALLKVEIALAPYIVAVEKAVGSADGLETAAYAGAIALGVLAVAAAVAAAPFIAAAAAITAVAAALRQAVALYKEWKALGEDEKHKIVRKAFSVGLIDDDARKRPGEGELGDGMSQADIDAFNRARRAAVEAQDAKSAIPAANADASKAAGNDAGKALGEGLIQGMSASEAAVKAAGGKLADAATQGVRDKAQIHSPSRVMRRDGRYMGEGVEEGIDDSAPAIQAAADRSLVPKVTSGVGGAAATKPSASIVIHNVFQISGGRLEDTKQAVLEALNEIMWKAKVAAGVPDEVTP